MKISVLASGSKGNSCFVGTSSGNYLIDLGISCLYAEKKLKDMNISPSVDGIFITHTHIDHIEGLRVFIKKYNPIIYLSQKMYDELSKILILNNYQIIDKQVIINNLTVSVIKTSHDTDDSNGYVFEENGSSVVYITDTGYINKKYHDLLKDRNAYVFESNHDVEMLMNNNHYPYQLKQRILGDKGHLSNEDSAYYLTEFISTNTKHIILAHLSEQNNTPELALLSLKRSLNDSSKHCDDIVVATQREKTELIEV